MALSTLYPPLIAAVVASLASVAGTALAGRAWLTRYLVPLSGLLLIAAAAFVLIPELSTDIGWLAAISLAAAGFALLAAVDHYAFPVCPSCTHGGKAEPHIEGVIAPLLTAVAIHAFVDGWGLVAVGAAAPGASWSITLAILLHKLPEGLILGALTRASVGSSREALGWCVLAEMATLAGGAAGLWLTPTRAASYPLALVAGTFLFLGSGAVRAQWRRQS